MNSSSDSSSLPPVPAPSLPRTFASSYTQSCSQNILASSLSQISSQNLGIRIRGSFFNLHLAPRISVDSFFQALLVLRGLQDISSVRPLYMLKDEWVFIITLLLPSSLLSTLWLSIHCHRASSNHLQIFLRRIVDHNHLWRRFHFFDCLLVHSNL